jgi:aryl-alcohol dehydrogenase-like predicted oxidoreductase
MKHHAFGSTGLTVSEIGFGGSRIGGVFADNNSSSKAALALLGKSLDAGITFYDTADMYAQGESEALIGTAFRGCRDKVVIATKGGYRLPARGNLMGRIKPFARPIVRMLGIKRTRLPSGLAGALSQDFSPAHLTRALEGSLKRLRTDHVDLYQLHSPGAAFMQSAAFGDALHTLEKLKSQGKLRFYGIATETPDEAPFGISAPGISSLQIGFGLLDMQALDEGTLAAASARGLGIIARGCYGGGLLKDGVDAERLKAATPKWKRILALRSFSKSVDRPVLEVALQFCRSTPGISVTLLGMRVEDHLRDTLRNAEGGPLTAAEFAALRQLEDSEE